MKTKLHNFTKSSWKLIALGLLTLHFTTCVKDDQLIFIHGKAVNPRIAEGQEGHILNASYVERIEGRSGSVEELVSKDAFVSAVVPDSNGNFSIQINKNTSTSLFLYLKNAPSEAEKILSVPIAPLSSDTQLGNVAFINSKHVNIRACWNTGSYCQPYWDEVELEEKEVCSFIGGNFNLQVENATSKEIWDASVIENHSPQNSQGQVEEAVLDYSSTGPSGCESITIVRETGSRYYFTLRFVGLLEIFNHPEEDPFPQGFLDYRWVKPTIEITSKTVRQKFAYSDNVNELFKASGTPGQLDNETPEGHKCDTGGTSNQGTVWIAATFQGTSLKPVDICIKNSVDQKIWPALFDDLEAYH